MIHGSAIIQVKLSYTDDKISSVDVVFADSSVFTYTKASDISEVFARFSLQQKLIAHGSLGDN